MSKDWRLPEAFDLWLAAAQDFVDAMWEETRLMKALRQQRERRKLCEQREQLRRHELAEQRLRPEE